MKNKLIIYLGVGALLAIAFVLAATFYRDSQKESFDFLASEYAEVFVRDHSPRYGNKEAKVILIEFLDPECESCRAFFPLVKSLIEEFDNKVQLVVRYAPFHGNSKIAIKALEAARMQGKYWESLELLFERLPEWGSHHDPKPDLIFEFLSQLDLDMKKLKRDMDAQSIEDIIAKDERDLKIIGVRGTPTFFVNGKPLEQFSAEALRELLSQEVKKMYP